MTRMHALSVRIRTDLSLASQALSVWTPRAWLIAGAASVATALVVGLATVLIPNPIFSREIAPVWWNYPAWLLTSVLSGMLLATYVRAAAPVPASADADGEELETSGRLGLAGAVLAWFAVGCPVCNKIALIALGYAGALTWFAPLQPVLALGAVALASVALVWRLRGQVACGMPSSVVAARA